MSTDEKNTDAPAETEAAVAEGEPAVRSRLMRPTGSVHYGDTDFTVDGEIDDATWAEVGRACCIHSPKEWAMIFIGISCVLFFLYFFLFSLELLGSSAKVFGGCQAGELFGDDTNPIAGLMVGILATVLLQSSSTTTSIVVSLTGSIITVNQGIYMIMGANIGTSVTCCLVALGQMGNGDQLERAFSAAVVHDLFNLLTVVTLLPIEVITGYLAHLTYAIVKNANQDEKGEKWEGPIKKIVSPLGNKLIIPNKNVIKAVAAGGSCDDFYPIECEGSPTYKSCEVGLIACDKKTNECPAFFNPNATKRDDVVTGGVLFFTAIILLFICLLGLVTVLQKMLMGMSTRVVHKATNVNPYLGIIIGAAVTMVVQSSSITTSILVPLCGIGVLQIEQMLPLTLGANIGTTITALIASLVQTGTDALQVALAHLFFNITGIIIWYPIPFMRRVPLAGSRLIGKATRLWRGFPVLYIIIVFFIMPLVFLGLSYLFSQGSAGFILLGSLLTTIMGITLIYFAYWFRFKDGKGKLVTSFVKRENKRTTMESLPEDMEYVKFQISRLLEHTGLPEEDEGLDEVELKNETEGDSENDGSGDTEKLQETQV